MAALSSPGIGSGLDVNNIVTQLVEAERQPFDTKAEKTEEKYNSQISDLGKLKSSISELDDALFDLKLPTTFSKRSVDTTSTNFEIEAGSAALPADYEIKVDQVATSQKLMMGPMTASAAIGSGSLTIGSAGLGKSFTLSVGASDTLDDVAKQINSATTNFGVVASIVKGDTGDFLTFSMPDTEGLDSVVSISVTDDDGLSFDDSGLSQLAYNYTTSELSGVTFGTSELAGEGSIRVNNGTDTVDIAVSATDTIEDVMNAINTAGINVTASFQDDGAGNNKLTFVSANTYGNHKVSIEILTDIDGDIADASGISRLAMTEGKTNYTETQAAQGAQITVNDSIVVTSNTNKFDTAIEGVIINAKKAHTGADGDNVTIKLDKESTKEAITKFVDAFNAMLEVTKEVTNSDANSGELGSLVGDNTVRNFLSQARRVIGSPVEIRNVQILEAAGGKVQVGSGVATGSLSSLTLSTLGITTERDGTLKLDEKVLDEQIEINFEHFSKFFSNEGGVGRELANVVSEYKGTGGIVDNKVQTLNKQLTRLNDEKENFDTKMQRYEARLYSQFNAMDLLVANLQSTSQYLEGALKTLPGVVKSSE